MAMRTNYLDGDNQGYVPARLRFVLDLTHPEDATPLTPATIAKAMLRRVVHLDPGWYEPSPDTVGFLADLAMAAERSTWDQWWLRNRERATAAVQTAMRHRGAALNVLDDLGLQRFSISADSLEPIFRRG